MGSGAGARSGVNERIEDFMRRRTREAAALGEESAAVARQAYGDALRASKDLNLPTAIDVVKYGAALISARDGEQRRPARERLDRSSTAKAIAGRPPGSTRCSVEFGASTSRCSGGWASLSQKTHVFMTFVGMSLRMCFPESQAQADRSASDP